MNVVIGVFFLLLLLGLVVWAEVVEQRVWIRIAQQARELDERRDRQLDIERSGRRK